MKVYFIFAFLFFNIINFEARSHELKLKSDIFYDGKPQKAAMEALAERLLKVNKIQKLDATSYFILKLASKSGLESKADIQSLVEKASTDTNDNKTKLVPYLLAIKALKKNADTNLSLAKALKMEFRTSFKTLDDLSASKVINSFVRDLNKSETAYTRELNKHKGKDFISVDDASELVLVYQEYQNTLLWEPVIDTLIAEDDNARYVIDKKLLVKTPEGAQIAAMYYRPKDKKKPIPALLRHTIYVKPKWDISIIRESAARGYIGAVSYTRGKAHSPEEIVPYLYEGRDVTAVINWLSAQSWNDGQVGMFGGSYDGFTQWAAAKYMPKALKTIVPYVAGSPGNSLPMENNIFLLVNYAWPFYTTNNKTLDHVVYRDNDRWRSLNDKWYQSGRSFREVDKVDGQPNPWFQSWLEHPSFDQYWQSQIPYKQDFAKVNIPVFSIAGYFDDGQRASINYMNDHYKYNPQAQHYLLIGPYDHFGAQRATKKAILRDYTIDPIAHFDTLEITYQWMDHIFRGANKPALLKDRVNYQVMGSNKWKHAPSLKKVSNEELTLYLSEVKEGNKYVLSQKKPSKPAYLTQRVDYADRTTINNDYYPYPIVDKKPEMTTGYVFMSEPFEQPIEVSGTFFGKIDATINKRDMDFGVTLYEVMPDGRLFHLSYYLGRASYAKDMTKRILLESGKVETLPFTRTGMTSRMLSRGSRLLVTLDINKNAYAQINYGTGKNVSDENISDAKEPLKVYWHNSSYIKVPIVR
ncbi:MULTISPECIES: CocE/NonD family hydrolase [Pseudoalteromonas]|uniref:Putative hydrolase, CocE/nonD family n=1 Tax=Pseudoalteromonas luteoviolacea (strain 2ta16) TaxID=1353533 RepID=V4HMY9_PSEL2|nr:MULTISPECIES: CocE/NonD family hydrolase [Pseudoalteromonas]ESP91148.1 putative hydrolase, CocE/nonD family [Pseudoalteromonas luteoviolacea 2ta16]KZN41318.1 hypothetical protein N483_15595 [Pseudoalteromonas luteoviolacea NCIMB 1944]MCG7550203.1 CocE/NonD family hydrolase [Pseudoalteromonas sp. Of7M-16]